jgi:hypothetical protein
LRAQGLRRRRRLEPVSHYSRIFRGKPLNLRSRETYGGPSLLTSRTWAKNTYQRRIVKVCIGGTETLVRKVEGRAVCWSMRAGTPVLFDDLKIVIHGKCARDAFGADARGVFIAFVIDNSLQRDVSVLHDNADGLLYP